MPRLGRKKFRRKVRKAVGRRAHARMCGLTRLLRARRPLRCG